MERFASDISINEYLSKEVFIQYGAVAQKLFYFLPLSSHRTGIVL